MPLPLKTNTRVIALSLLLMCIPSGKAWAQGSAIDSLWALLKSPRVKQMSFDDHIGIQRDYPNEDKDLVIAFADELLSRKDLMENDSLKAVAYSDIGENYRNFGDNEKAKFYIEESIATFSKVKYSPKSGEAINRLGIYYANTDEDSLAAQYYTKAIEVAAQNLDTVGIIRPQVGLAALFIKMGLYDKALGYAFDGLTMAQTIGNPRAIATLSNNIAIAFQNQEKYDSAILFFKKALAINAKTTNYETIIRNLSNIGTTYLYKHELDSASFYMNRAEGLLPKINVPRTSVYTYAALARVSNSHHAYKKAIGYADKAIATAIENDLEGMSDEAYLAKVEAYKNLKMPDSALVALEKYWSIKQKFLEESRNSSVVKIEQQFQQYKKEKEIEIKTGEIALLKKDQALGATQRNAAIMLAILLGLTAVLFYNRFRLKKKTSDALALNNIEIEKQKQVIEASLRDKETLLREIHHRVKNNLQIISSLLNIQSSHIQDENVLSSIREGQSRVQAMSLIHQNLYQSEHINNVDIENYLQQLVSYLSSLFERPDHDVSVTVDAPAIQFDIDTAIPLGLIVNELVSNAYKYAFDRHVKGTIQVGIKPINEVEYELEVADNGRGFSDDFHPENGNSIGLKLVKILSRQLRGSFTSHSDHGAIFQVRFKDLRAYLAE